MTADTVLPGLPQGDPPPQELDDAPAPPPLSNRHARRSLVARLLNHRGRKLYQFYRDRARGMDERREVHFYFSGLARAAMAAAIAEGRSSAAREHAAEEPAPEPTPEPEPVAP